MDEQIVRERIRSLEEHADKLVAQSDALKAQLTITLAERDAEIAALRQQVAELQAWKASVPVEAINAWWQSPVNWTGYDHAQYDAWYKAVKAWVHGLKVND